MKYNIGIYFIDLVASRMPKVKPDRSEVTKFDKDNLKHVNTTDKTVLPDQKGTVGLVFCLFISGC